MTDHDDERLDERVEALEARVDELDAGLQAVRGFLGGVSAVNEGVERRADAAVAAVERLEARLDERPGSGDTEDPTGAAGTTGEAERPVEGEKVEQSVETDEGRGLRERLRELR